MKGREKNPYAGSFFPFPVLSGSDLRGHFRFDALVTCVHAVDGLTVPAEIDLRLFVIADAVDELVDQPDPLVEVGVLNRVAVVRRAVMIDIGPETVADNGSLFPGRGIPQLIRCATAPPNRSCESYS